MHIVIDIPDEMYDWYDTGFPDEDDAEKLWQIVKNGTLLPKGHGRLIDADKTISKICGNSCGCHREECGHDESCFSVTRIESAPTIIEADKAEGSGEE